MVKFLKSFLRETSGATAIEYGLLIGLLSAVIVASLTTIGLHIGNKLNILGAALN